MATVNLEESEGIPERSVQRAGVNRLGVGGLRAVPEPLCLPAIAAGLRFVAEEDRKDPVIQPDPIRRFRHWFGCFAR